MGNTFQPKTALRWLFLLPPHQPEFVRFLLLLVVHLTQIPGFLASVLAANRAIGQGESVVASCRTSLLRERAWERGFPEGHRYVHRLQGMARRAQDPFPTSFSWPLSKLGLSWWETQKRKYVWLLCKTLDCDELYFLYYERQTILSCFCKHRSAK